MSPRKGAAKKPRVKRKGASVAGTCGVAERELAPGAPTGVSSGPARESAITGRSISPPRGSPVRCRIVEQRSTAPMAVLAPLLRGYQEKPDWPPYLAAADRIGPTYLLHIYQHGGLGVEYGMSWLRARGLERCESANEMLHLLAVVDQLLLFDDVDVVNSSGAEILLRRCYGLERVFEDVHCEADWVDSETSKMKPWLLERYDATSLLGRALRIPAVEKTVLRETRRRSQFDKCLERLRASAAQ